MLQHLTTVRKVGLGFLFLTLVLILAVGLTIWQVARTQNLIDQLVDQQAPLSDASLRTASGVNASIAALRGWMLLADERFKIRRNDAWTDEIEPGMRQLKSKVSAAGNPKWQRMIDSLETALANLKQAQDEVEGLANTPGNFPATEMLVGQAMPKSAIIRQAISSMIDAEEAQEATDERRDLLIAMANFRGAFALGLSSLHAYLLTGDDIYANEFARYSETNQQAFEAVNSLASLLTPAQAREWQALQNARQILESLTPQMFQIRRAPDWNLANSRLRDSAAPRAVEAQKTLNSLLDELGPEVAANRAQIQDLAAFLTGLEWLLLAIGVLFSGIIATVIIRDVKRSIRSVINATQEVATSSTEIATSAQQQVTSLNEMATALNEITATSEEFKATMQEFADRARAVQEAADETAKLTDEGRVLTQESATRIGQVRSNSQAAGESVLNLAEQMQRIGEITASVNEIAEQTKLLALNASIEAARAGDEGRGFAVVATQVRELANQSKESAGRIEALITDTQKSMQDVVGRIEDGAQLSDEAAAIVVRMTRSFEEIAQAIEQTTEAMTQINTGARQQEQGISELVSSITEIDSASRESLSSAEQTQKSILLIDSEMQRLSEAMKSF